MPNNTAFSSLKSEVKTLNSRDVLLRNNACNFAKIDN